MTDRTRLVLTDDHPIFRSGLKALLELEPDMQIVGEAASGEQAIERATALRPDLVIMDLEMPGIGGLEATRQIRALGSAPRVLVLTSHAEADFLLPVLDAGGSGFVQKSNVQEDLLEAIRVVARNEVYLCPGAAGILLQGYRSAGQKPQPGPLDDLTERERNVLSLTAAGYSATEIGRKLFLSPKTVETYRSRLMHKLNLQHRSELVRLALRTGMLRDESKGATAGAAP